MMMVILEASATEMPDDDGCFDRIRGLVEAAVELAVSASSAKDRGVF